LAVIHTPKPKEIVITQEQTYPIFIVGPPRSGTTLLTAMLAAHSHIAAGPETQFFSKLSTVELKEAIADPDWPTKALQRMESITLAGKSVCELYGLSREDMRRNLVNRQPSIQAMLEAFTLSYARRKGKRRWLEKTPNHLLHLDLIRLLYPTAPIIRIIRDPRDSAISIRKLPWASRSVIANCYLWLEWHNKSNNFFQRDAMSITIIYEDLVREPKKNLRRICDFIGEDFEESMIHYESSMQDIVSVDESWKKKVSQPLDRNRLKVWKRELTSDIVTTVNLICHEPLIEFGYEKEVEKPKTILPVYPLTRGFVEHEEKLIIAAAREGKLFYPANNLETDIILIQLPSWGKTSKKRIIRITNFVIKLITFKSSGKKVFFSDKISSCGINDKIALFLLNRLAKRVKLVT